MQFTMVTNSAKELLRTAITFQCVWFSLADAIRFHLKKEIKHVKIADHYNQYNSMHRKDRLIYTLQSAYYDRSVSWLDQPDYSV
jgi:hypothetical protein